MTEVKDNQVSIDKARSHTKSIAWVAAIIYVLAVAVYIGWFGYHLNYDVSPNSADWGTFGDFVGGLINPAISLATLILVALAYLAQRQELSETIKALSDSAKEQERQAQISILQGQLNAKTALLNRKIQSLAGLRDEVSRIASVQQIPNSTSPIIHTFRGKALTGAKEREQEIKAFLPTIDEVVKEIETLETEVKDLGDQLSSHSTGDGK